MTPCVVSGLRSYRRTPRMPRGRATSQVRTAAWVAPVGTNTRNRPRPVSRMDPSLPELPGDPRDGRPQGVVVVRRWRRTLAEDRGFEPLRAFTQRAFQARALGHYANPPSRRLPEGEPHSTIGGHYQNSGHLGTRLELSQTPRVVVPHRTPPGPEGSKGRRALPGTRGVLYAPSGVWQGCRASRLDWAREHRPVSPLPA